MGNGTIYRSLAYYIDGCKWNGYKKRLFTTDPISCLYWVLWCLSEYMYGWKFEQISAHLRLTDYEPPSYQDKLYDVIDLISAWNERMKVGFSPS